ncbi:MAG: nucleotidyltransferase domain-containing protein [Elusimicrobia bacterium]|nr:nucleotidyltransferase domain-containing protein [Elusimicrobiota bacterium]
MANSGVSSAREKEILKKSVQALRKYLSPRRIILFGSRAKGKSQKGSDFDLAVDGRQPPAEISRRMRDEIEKFGGLYHVDIVYLAGLNPGLRRIVLKSGKVVYERRT